MIKKLKLSVVMIACLALLLTFSGCNTSKETKAAAGRYDLTLLTCDTLPTLNAGLYELYEYNYIILTENGKYEIENKSGSTTVSQKGTFSVEGSKITFVTRDGCTKITEEYILENNVIKMKVMIETYEVEMELTKK